MASSKQFRTGIAVNALGKFAEGFNSGLQDKQKLQQLLAEREYQKQKDAQDLALTKRAQDIGLAEKAGGQTVIGANGQTYQSQGMAPEYLNRFGFSPVQSALPGAVQTGPGKVTVQSPAKEKPVTPETLLLTGEQARGMGGTSLKGKHVVIVPDEKKANGKMSPAQMFALSTAKELFKTSLTRPLNEHEVNTLADASKSLDLNMVPEEDQGIGAFIQKALGDTQYHPVTSNAPVAPAVQNGMIRVKKISNGQKGSIHESEFNPKIYQRI